MLHAPVPNPTSLQVTYRIDIPWQDRARVQLVDVTGRMIARLVDRELAPGTHTFTSALSPADGRSLPAGIFYLRLDVCGVQQIRRVVVVR